MNIAQNVVDRAIHHVMELCRLPSPTGFTALAEGYVEQALQAAGLKSERTVKRSVLVDLGGEGRPLVMAAHIDTLGLMVRSIKSNGRLRYAKIGGFPDFLALTENVTIHARDGRRYSGTLQPTDASVHVNAKLAEQKLDDEHCEIVIDEKVSKKDHVRELGVAPGDFVSLDPRTVLTESGYLKSRHLDDKASAGVLLALAEAVAAGELKLARKVWLLFTTYEEVGHGGAVIPEGAVEILSVDMGAVGDDLSCTDRQVSICAKDSGGPYDRDVTQALIEAAGRAGCDFAVDVYPRYSSDANVSLAAGHDVRHGLVGPGVYASHGYERTHSDAIANTLALLFEYAGH